MTKRSRLLGYLLLISMLCLSACKPVEFTPELTPLALGTLDSPSAIQTPAIIPPENPPISMENLTSEEAIDLCERREYFGDENMGSCLAPGGETYFVWIFREEVMEVDRDSEFIVPFRMAVLNRSDAIGTIYDKSLVWRDVVLFLGEGVVLAPLCGGAIVSGASGAIPATATLGGLCALDAFALWDSGDRISRDAQALVETLNAFYEFQIDAAWNYCRMEGKSDEECN